MRARSLLCGALVIAATAATCEDPTAPDTCVTGQVLTVGTAISGAVAGGDCAIEDRHADSYAFTLAAESNVRFNVSAQTETDIRIRKVGATATTEVVVHENSQKEFTTFAALPAGSYILDVSASDDGDAGTYTITPTTVASPGPVGCLTPPVQMRFAAIGVADLGGSITSGDCAGSAGFFYDNYNVYMTAGNVRKITVTGSAGTTIEIRLSENPTLATTPKTLNTAGANIVTFTPATSGYYAIGIIAGPAAGTITYSLKVE